MRLFHFTALHHLEGGWPADAHAGFGIRNIGIRPNRHPLIALPALVWLTEDGDWQQMWSPRPVPGINCDRTEVRIEVIVPKSSRAKLLTVDRIVPFVDPGWREDFTGGFDLRAWRAFPGSIPVGWLRTVLHRERLAA